jgi:hypothetical protein
MSKVDALFAEAKDPRGEEYWSTLREIVRRVRAGERRPSFQKIADFLGSSHETTRRHYRKVEREQKD